MTDQIKTIEAEIKKCEAELDHIYETYSGCDWCCGGGDEAVVEIGQEIEGLQHSRKVIRLRLVRLSLRD
jgi:hypothetical protein